ncbi:MAG: M81 family metallopeptidase [Candidatus Latescibacteria bacterium]|nr:M81 family metallopeptidase [Candidatus Latescibacterota bacterium]
MSRILIAECKQEISSFNPVTCTYDNFTVNSGEQLFTYHNNMESEISGALSVFRQRSDLTLIPAYGARSTSAGPLEQESFNRIASAFINAIQEHAQNIDACYFAMHGAMGTTEELDPEGYLLQEARKILGPDVPIVLSLDLHGILTERMLTHSNGLALYHTYPHVDFANTGERAAKLLLRILDDNVKPVVARVRVPVLVRGDELITETGVFGQSIRYAQQLEKQENVLAAGMMIGNPFTDVPELCTQSVVVTNNDPDLAQKEALQMAQDFWSRRSQMQPKFSSISEAIDQANKRKGPFIFTDAADAPSSGAPGDSNALLAALIEHNYQGQVLLPIVDAPAVQKAFEAGVGKTITIELGGRLDPRFKPVKIEAAVDMLSRGQFISESWGNLQDGGPTAVLKNDHYTIVVVSRSISFVDRSVFLGHGQDPKQFDVIIVKSPHCQYHFFDEWAEENFNIDAPGATSANLKTLGHTICQRPMYPLDESVTFDPQVEIYT